MTRNKLKMIDISSLAERMIEQNKNANNPNSNQQKINQSDTLHKNNFKFLYVIGKGGFGRVWKIQSKKTKIKYALKEMSKLKIIDKKSEKSINSEREFLSKLHHPFIVNMHYAFQDKENLYLVMDLLNGGDLRFHVSRYRKFSEEQTRFFIANIVYALEYIHQNNVIHRDIKPENLVLDENGYVRITDFGIAKENMPDNSSETSGTPGYMAPEVMKSKNHSFPVDFFAIGVIGYEFMTGNRPYCGKNRKEIKEQMLSKPAIINEENIAKGWSQGSADFINKLLERKESKRLGFQDGAKELMNHHWLKYYPWDELKEKTLLAPFIPDPKDNYDKSYCESIEKITEETKSRYEEIYCSPNFRKNFLNFYYNEDEVLRQKKEEKEKEKEKEEQEKNEKEKNEKEKNEKEKVEKDKAPYEIGKTIKNSNSVNNYIQKYNINNIGGQNNNFSNNFFNKIKPNKTNNNKELQNYNKNKQINNNNNNKNISGNVVKNIRVNKLNNKNSCNSNEFKANSNINLNMNMNNNLQQPESSNISSINNMNKRKECDPNNNPNSKTNVISSKKQTSYIKPLSHSNSTKEIYSNNSLEKYIKIKQNQLIQQKNKNQNQYQNLYRQKNNSINKNNDNNNNNNNSNLNNNSKYNKIPPSAKDNNGTSININNYYTNNIFSAIYNNFMPHNNYERKIVNEDNKVKKPTQRASSVFCQKRQVSKSNLSKNKNKNENDKKSNNKLNFRK